MKVVKLECKTKIDLTLTPTKQDYLLGDKTIYNNNNNEYERYLIILRIQGKQNEAFKRHVMD